MNVLRAVHIKEHQSHSKTGKVETVKEHEDKRVKQAVPLPPMSLVGSKAKALAAGVTFKHGQQKRDISAEQGAVESSMGELFQVTGNVEHSRVVSASGELVPELSKQSATNDPRFEMYQIKPLVFSKEESAKMAGAVFMHNHPNGVSFSFSDIALLFKRRLAEMVAVGHLDGQKVSYHAKPGPSGTPDIEEIESYYMGMEHRGEDYHDIWTKLSKQFKFSYERKFW